MTVSVLLDKLRELQIDWGDVEVRVEVEFPQGIATVDIEEAVIENANAEYDRQLFPAYICLRTN